MPSERKERTTPLMMGQVLGKQDALGPTTKRFFAEGEEHERRGWDDVLPLDDDELKPRRRGSVDKVPRRLSAVLALVLLCICLALAVAVGSITLFAKGNGGGSVTSIVRSIRSLFTVTSDEPAAVSPSKQTPAERPRTEPQPLAQPPAQPLPQPVAQSRAPTHAAAAVPAAAPPASKALAIPVAVPRQQQKIPNAAVPSDVEGAERLRQDAIAVRKRRHQRHAEDDYVWSQELKALVPASSMEQPPAQPNASPRR